MRINILASIVSVLACIYLLFITPSYAIGLTKWNKSVTMVQNETRNFIDTVVDTRSVSESMLADFKLAMSSVSEYLVVDIEHEVKIIEPDPIAGAGRTRVTYIPSEDLSTFKQGDRIIVTVHTVRSNPYQYISSSITGTAIQDCDFTSCGKIR